jgi:hypothetical protein
VWASQELCCAPGLAFPDGCSARPSECWVAENPSLRTCVRDDRKCLAGEGGGGGGWGGRGVPAVAGREGDTGGAAWAPAGWLVYALGVHNAGTHMDAYCDQPAASW